MIVCMYGVRKVIAHGYTQSGCIQYSKYSYVIHTYVYMSLYMSQCVYMYTPMSSLRVIGVQCEVQHCTYTAVQGTSLYLHCTAQYSTVLHCTATVQHCT